MDQQTLLYIMTAFVVIAGISLFMQFVMIFGIYRTVKTTQQKVEEFLPQVQSLIPKVQELIPKVQELFPKIHGILDSSQKTIEQSRGQILDITAKTNDLLDSTKRQMAKVEEVVNDATGRAKVQLERAEMVIDDTMGRAHETVALVHGGIMKPLREVHGVAAGLKAALNHLARNSRPSVDKATHDEEMFI
jgi:ABC-type transporter Mla subunit MlaD